MDNLGKLIAAYQRMDEWGQRFVLNMAEAQAQRHPVESLHRPRAIDGEGSAGVSRPSSAIAVARGAARQQDQLNLAVYTREPPVLYVVK